MREKGSQVVGKEVIFNLCPFPSLYFPSKEWGKQLASVRTKFISEEGQYRKTKK